MTSTASIVLFAFLTLTTLVSVSQGLLCYHCSVPPSKDGEEQDLTCVTEPWKVPGSVRTCLPHLKACRTMRTEYKDTGRIKSFVRGCSFAGKDSEETVNNYIMMYRHCFTNKCNKGDGKDNDKDGQKSRITAILVPHVTSSAIAVRAVTLLLMMILVPNLV